MSHADLDGLIAADEEARARVASAEREAKGVTDAARATAEERRREREERAGREREAEIARIGDEARSAASQRRERREAWRIERRRAAETLLPEAALLWARIVLEGES